MKETKYVLGISAIPVISNKSKVKYELQLKPSCKHGTSYKYKSQFFSDFVEYLLIFHDSNICFMENSNFVLKEFVAQGESSLQVAMRYIASILFLEKYFWTS